jgi:hypothetical protein
MNQQELQRILLMPEGLRAQYLAALKKPQKMADGGGFGRKAQRINQATSFGDEPMGNQIIKETGGNWLGGNVEKALDPLTRTVLNDTGVNNLRSRQGDEVANAYLKERPRHEAANNWVRGNLTNYVKKHMATEADPVRKLAEQGISHFPVVDDPRFWNRKGESAREALSGRQVGKSDLAKQWENRSDSMIEHDTAQSHADMMHLAPGMYSEKDAWIKNAPPETKIHTTTGNLPGFNAADLGFDHIMDVLKEDLAEGRIRPEQLSKISMEQAVRRVHEYDQDKLKKMKEAQIKNTEGMPVHKVYDDGHKWIELAMNNELPQGFTQDPSGAYVSPTGEKSLHHPNYVKLQDALKYEGDTMGHCVGGYCPEVAEGRSRIFSLRDAKGEPHVTVETSQAPHPISTSRRGDNFPELNGFEYGSIYSGASPYKPTKEQLKQIHAKAHELWRTQGTGKSMEIDDFSQQAANEILGSMPNQIIQIKGKGNGKPVAKYIPMVQDFVKSHSWADVGDLQNTGLRKTSDAFNVNERKMIEQTGIKLPAYATPEEIKHIHDTVWPQIAKKADGGSMKASERDANLAKFMAQSKAPERVYHGTGNLESLQAFDPAMTGKGTDQLGSGFYFSNKPNTASGYAPAVTGGNSPGMVAAHLALRKPIKIGPKGSTLNDSNVKLTHDQVKRIMAHAPNLYDTNESPLANHFDLSKGVKPKMIHDVAQYYTGPQTLHMLENDVFPHHPTEYRHALHKVLGYDGVVKDFGNGEKHYVAWFPHQVKSAIGNRGTYDPNETDITKAQGGAVKPVGYTKEKVTVSPSLDRMQYELMSVKHFKKAK